MVDANQRFARFDSLISLESVAELRGFEASDHQLRIGGALTLSELAEQPHGISLFDQLLPSFASRLIRNRATLAGNLATASPIGDAAPVLLALEATVHCASAQGTRAIPLDRFFTGYRRNLLAPGEIITELQVPLPAPALQRFYKVSKRNLDDISTVAAAFALDLQDGKVQRLRVAFGGIAATPLRAYAVEQLALGKPWQRSTLAELLLALESLGTPMSDLRGSAHYRRALIGRLLEKFWTETRPEGMP
jgi:xanthine dehydrogenase small subunit